MNLARHASVLWRFRQVTAIGVLLAVALAVLASYKVTTSGLEARGVSTYSSVSQLLVTQAGFPEGRVVLPTGAPTGTATTEERNVDPNRLEFADPNRFMSLADLYTKLILSDEVRGRITERPAAAQIDASPLPAVSGAPILPIIQLTTKADSAGGARSLNVNAAAALRGLLEQRQARNDISPAQRVRISTLNAPSAGVLAQGPSHMGSILALLLCLIGTVAVTHLLASLRPEPEAEAADPSWVEEPAEAEPLFDEGSERERLDVGRARGRRPRAVGQQAP